MTREEWAAKRFAWRQWNRLVYCCYKWSMYIQFDKPFNDCHVSQMLKGITGPPRPTIEEYEEIIKNEK